MTEAIDRKSPPRIKDAIEFNLSLKPYTKAVLDNGVEVYAIDAGAEDLLQVEWVFFSGNWFEEKNLIAASTNYLLKNGTSKKNAFQINEHFEYYGSYLNRSCYNETATVSLHCMNKHLEPLLPVVQELLIDSVFPEDELATYKQNMQQRLRVNLKKGDFIAGRLIDTYLHGEEHPYGRFSRFEDFEAVTRENLLEFYNNYYKNGKFILFVAGKLPANIFPLLNKSFGTLPLTSKEVFPIPIQPSEEKKFRVINDPQGVQGAIRMGIPFPGRHHPDFLKAQVLNTVLGGFFGSRLMRNIREDKGYTYGIHSYLQNHMQHSAWLISTEAGRDVAEAAIVEVYKEMDILRSETIGDEELLLVKNYLIGSILGDLDGPFQLINRWKNIILNNLAEDYFDRQIETIKNITSEELKDLANKYLKNENFYELVVI